MNKARDREARRHVIITVLFTALLAVALGTSGCGKQLARMESQQVKLQAMIMANARQLATVSSQVHVGQNTTNQALAQLDQKAQDITGEILTVQNTQGQLHETIVSGNEQANKRMARLERNQASLKDGIAQVADVAGKTNVTVNAVAQDQATLHRMVQANKAELAKSLAAVAKNQATTHSGLDQLHQADRSQTSALAGLANKQEVLAKLAQDNHKHMTGQITTLSSDQKRLRSDLGNLRSLTQTVAADVTTLGNEQRDLHSALKSSTTSLAEKIAVLQQHQLGVQSVIDRVANTTDATAGDVTALAATQAQMQEAQGTRYAALNGQLETVAENQQGLQSSLETLDTKADQTTAHLDTLTSGQDGIQKTLRVNHASVAGEFASLANSQKSLHDDVRDLTGNTEALAADLGTVIGKQAALQDAWTQSNEVFATMSENQAAMQHDLDTLDAKAEAMATQANAITEGQRGLRAGIDQLGEKAGQISDLAAGQEAIQGNIEALTATTSQIGLDVIGVGKEQENLRLAVETRGDALAENTTQLAAEIRDVTEGQNALSERLAGHDQTVSQQMANLNETQGQIHTGLDSLTATTTQVALDVITLDEKQTKRGQSTEANQERLAARLDGIAEDQGQLQTGLDSLTTTTTQVALDVITLDEKQTKQGQATQANQQHLAAKLDGIAADQGQLQTGLDSLTTTTTQVALDVLTMDEKQGKRGEVTTANQQQLASQLSALAADQKQLESGLDTITATTSQVALDVIALDSGQAKLSEAVQANRQELVTKLAELAEGQKLWLARFDATEAKVATMTAGIASLEQRVSKMQGTLQQSLADIGTLLDADSQQRVQFQDSVRQDMRSVSDSISQLREIQSGLAEHIQRVQDSTQNQTGDILSALEELQQQKTDVAVPDLSAELKSSKASPREIVLP